MSAESIELLSNILGRLTVGVSVSIIVSFVALVMAIVAWMRLSALESRDDD